MFVEYLVLFATLGISSHAAAQITSDTYFYGDSPAVYPSPNITGSGDWGSAYAKAKAFVSKLTIEEKSNLTFGVTSTNGCSGNIPAISRLGFPGLCLSDAGNGLRSTDFVNGYPSGIHTGASWNKTLAYARGSAMGYEFRTKGVNIALGPVVGPLGRLAEGGRNWEGISNDPYLCGILGGETVEGFQDTGVITSAKHYIGNEQETNRNPTTETNGTIAAVSSNIDDRTMHELYLWPFADLVHSGTGNIMCSYNRVNNSYGCQNSKTLNGLLKTELGFQGFVVSDWYAQHSGISSTLAGLEMAMPTGQDFWGSYMIEAIKNGTVPEWRLDDMVTRIIAAWYKMGQDSGYPTPGIGMPASLSAPHKVVNAKSPSAKSVLLQGAIEGHVLVKNVNSALPLKNPQLIYAVGYDAVVESSYDAATIFSFAGATIKNSTLFVGGGSGSNSPAYISSPFEALSQRAWEDDTSFYWDVINEDATASINPESDACLVFINGYATEGADRTALHDAFSDELVNNIAAQCANTIVVIHSAGIHLVDQFVNNVNVTAIIMAHLPGQDSGRALVSLLYGDSNPSGKLPYTIAKNESDYGSLLAPTEPEAGEYALFPQANFTEGLYIDYRAFDASNIEPRYEFGFGLSYTTYSYSNLHVGPVINTNPYPSGTILQGGRKDLWDTILTISATITNTGKVDGQEVVQLYLGIPNSPVRQLRGFEKVFLRAGEGKDVQFQVRRRDLSVWDTGAQEWKLQKGSYGVFVGASSRKLLLNGTLSI